MYCHVYVAVTNQASLMQLPLIKACCMSWFGLYTEFRVTCGGDNLPKLFTNHRALRRLMGSRDLTGHCMRTLADVVATSDFIVTPMPRVQLHNANVLSRFPMLHTTGGIGA